MAGSEVAADMAEEAAEETVAAVDMAAEAAEVTAVVVVEVTAAALAAVVVEVTAAVLAAAVVVEETEGERWATAVGAEPQRRVSLEPRVVTLRSMAPTTTASTTAAPSPRTTTNQESQHDGFFDASWRRES